VKLAKLGIALVSRNTTLGTAPGDSWAALTITLVGASGTVVIIGPCYRIIDWCEVMTYNRAMSDQAHVFAQEWKRLSRLVATMARRRTKPLLGRRVLALSQDQTVNRRSSAGSILIKHPCSGSVHESLRRQCGSIALNKLTIDPCTFLSSIP
jgi:hypothetical protein